jgi:hypothetical protein
MIPPPNTLRAKNPLLVGAQHGCVPSRQDLDAVASHA